MLAWLGMLGWLACVVYSTIPAFWLLIHSRIGHWRSRTYLPYRALVPLWIGMWIVVGLISSPWHKLAFYHSGWAWFPAALLFAVGLWLYRAAGANFSKHQLYGLSELKMQNAEQRLAIIGIRSRVRHPVYLGHLCEMLAWAVGSGLAVCFALAVFGIVTGAFMIRAEDAELEQRFGEEYRVYRNSVPAILPRLGPANSRL